MFVFLHRNRRSAFRYTPGLSVNNDGLDSEPDENVDCSPGSPVPPYLAKTSSSEWNSSDDLAGPFSEQEETSTVAHMDTFLHNYPPHLPPKTFGSSDADPSGIHLQPPEVPARLSSRNEPKNGSCPITHTTLHRWIETPAEHRLSSDASSKSGSSDQDRNDLSASESDERLPSPKPVRHDDIDSASLTDRVLPTTYFSVDNCMTDTYRAKYHRRPALYMKAEDHASSGESDIEGRLQVLPDVQQPEPSKSRTESGIQQHSVLVSTPRTLFETSWPFCGCVKTFSLWLLCCRLFYHQDDCKVESSYSKRTWWARFPLIHEHTFSDPVTGCQKEMLRTMTGTQVDSWGGTCACLLTCVTKSWADKWMPKRLWGGGEKTTGVLNSSLAVLNY